LYLLANHPEEAAITLVEALLIDGNRKDALSALTDIYRQIDHEGCALVTTGGQPRLNADCAIVHNHLCSAAIGLIRIFVEAKQFDVAAQMQHTALQTYHCPSELFQTLIPNKPTTSPKP
jgi:hypothetical protein